MLGDSLQHNNALKIRSIVLDEWVMMHSCVGTANIVLKPNNTLTRTGCREGYSYLRAERIYVYTYSGIIRNPKLFSKSAFMACMMAVLGSRLHEEKVTKTKV